MNDQTNAPQTEPTTTTNGTTTPPADGSASVIPQKTTTGNDDGGLAAALGDGKPTADAAAGDAPKTEDKPSPGAPEKYEAWTVPEGYELDAGLVEQATPIFRELGLTQEQSQKLVSLYNEHAVKASKETENFWLETRQQWREELKADAQMSKLAGPDGNFGPDSPLIKTFNEALNGLQNPKLVADFKAGMILTGAGDNPAFVKVFYALAKQLTEGSEHVTGGPLKASDRPKTAAAAVFPNLKSADDMR